MQERTRNYQSVDDMSALENAGLGRHFLAIVAGKTNGAHQEIVDNLKRCGQVEVDVHGDADYLMVFCPISSRVETDITEALSKVPAGKPVILVVMHYTFDAKRIIAESRRQVHSSEVVLTVDYLFHDGKLLRSTLNDISWHEIQKFLGVSTSQFTWIQTLRRCWRKHRSCITYSIAAFVVVALLYYIRKPNTIEDYIRHDGMGSLEKKYIIPACVIILIVIVLVVVLVKFLRIPE